MKKIFLRLLIVLAFLAVIALGWRFFGGNEDDWICTQDGWTRHGNPSASIPLRPCINGKISDKIKLNVYFGNGKLNPNAADCSLVFPVEREALSSQDQTVAALNLLFAGPTEAEKTQGYFSFFSSDTHDLFRQLKVENEIAYVDLKDFRRIIPNANSSCGGAQFLSALDTTVKNINPNIKKVIYSIEGEPSTFYEWMQIGCDETNNWCNSPFSKLSVTPKSPTSERICRDECGNGACQEIVCLGAGCPCPESHENCVSDCLTDK